MPKSHAQSDSVLQRLKGLTAPPIAETWVNLLTTLPTDSIPQGYVEWRSATSTIIPRKRVYGSSSDGSPSWSSPTVDGNAKKVVNVGSVSWSETELATLLDGTQVIKGVGVWKSGNVVYADGVPMIMFLTDLIYWEPLPSNLTVKNGEAVVFLDGNLKVTEQ